MNGSGSKNKIIISLILKALAAALFLTVLNRVLMPKYVSENQDGRITADFYKEELAPDVIFVGSYYHEVLRRASNDNINV